MKGFTFVYVLHTHDETTMNSSDGETDWWGERGFDPITSKSRGKNLMISDFCNIADGFLSLTDEEFATAKEQHAYDGPQHSRVELEPSKGVWFCSEDLLAQVRQFKKLADYISTHI